MTPGAALLRALVGLAPVAAVLVAAPSGALPAPWFAVLLTLVAVGAAVAPDSPLGLAASGLALGWWVFGSGAELTGPPVTALAAAAALVVGHVAGVVLSYGPVDLPVDRALALLWVARGALALGVAVPAWLLARSVEGQSTPAGVWALALVGLAAAVALAGAWFAPRRDLRSGRD